MKNFVWLRLIGGLGNQLFQISAAIYVAQRMGKQTYICVDTRFLSSYESKRDFDAEFMLDTIQLPILVTHKNASKINLTLALLSKYRLGRIFDLNIAGFFSTSKIKKLDQISSEKTSVLLDGYFINSKIPNAFFPRKKIYEIAQKRVLELDLPKNLENKLNIGVHIRRGDYLSSKKAVNIFEQLDFKFYKKALDLVSKYYSKEMYNILVFSDDKQVSVDAAIEFNGISINALGLSTLDEFFLLSTCDNYIIANSTFSWWASFIGYDETKKIIAPRNWYKDKKRNLSNDLLMNHFILI